MKQVWCRKYSDEMNVKIDFVLKLRIVRGMELKLAANIPFRMSLDGEIVGYGPKRRAQGFAAVNRYDLSTHAGKTSELRIETISYRVWNFYVMNQSPFFAAEIVKNGEVVADSYDFSAFLDRRKLQKVQRYGFQRGFTEVYDYTLKEPFEALDFEENNVCTLIETDVPDVLFCPEDFVLYESGRIFFTEGADFDDGYYNRGMTMRFSESEQYRITKLVQTIGFIREKENSETMSEQYRIYSLKNNRTGFVQFEVRVEKEARILFEYDEKLSPVYYDKKARSSEYGGERTEKIDLRSRYVNGASNVDIHRLHCISAFEYRLPAGRYKLTSFEPDAMKYLRLSVISGKAEIYAVKLIPYEYSQHCREFDCADEELKLLYESAVRTFRANAVDILTDCPSRERAGWLCDSYFSGRAERFLTGGNAVEYNFLENFALRENEGFLPDEMFPMCYPADHPDGKFIPNWGLWLILELFNFEKANPSRRMAEKLRDKCERFIGWLVKFLNGEGLLENPDGWGFVEWSRANDLISDVNFPTNMLFCAALRALNELYGGNYGEIADKTEKAIYDYAFNGKFFVDNAFRINGRLERNTEWTETCQYYAFYFGFADKERNPNLYETMFEKIRTYRFVGDEYPNMYPSDAFIGVYLKLDYLYKIGNYGILLEEIKNYFSYQAEETGTLWEYREPRASCCHGFASIIAEWIFNAVKC